MADSTIADVTKMKVVDLRKELKSRGLPSTGDKAELITRLQTAMSTEAHDEHGDINLDSDEIDSDGEFVDEQRTKDEDKSQQDLLDDSDGDFVLDKDEDKSHQDLLDDSAVESINEELALAENPPQSDPLPDSKANEAKAPKSLKRKITMSDTEKVKKSDTKIEDNKETVAKKIVLNRSSSTTTTAATNQPDESSLTANTDSSAKNGDKIKIAADIDAKTKLELRAKRFGLPVKMSDAERKEARKQRFGENAAKISVSNLPADNIDKLKKRAERFGQSVSKFMTEIENKEKIEKRKAKFGTVK